MIGLSSVKKKKKNYWMTHVYWQEKYAHKTKKTN